jgi:hypothetical protein
MAGIAVAAAELYARHNIPVIPIGADKRPLVGGFKVANLTMAQSRAYMQRKSEADALGIPDGRLSGIVRLDIDAPVQDVERVAREVIRRAGDTPGKIETASGKMHLLYAYNGERRLTGKAGHSNARPWSDLPVDLCASGGYSISPPSRVGSGEYKLLGDMTLDRLLENRDRLPSIKGLGARAYTAPKSTVAPDVQREDDLRLIGPGSRDAVFYREVARICQGVYRAGGTRDDAYAAAMLRHAEFPVPHEHAEDWVRKKVDYWWRLTEADQNRFGTGHRPRVRDWVQELGGTDPELFALLIWLKQENGPESEFWIANGMVGTHLTGRWSSDKLRSARQRALDGKWIEMIVRAAQGRHAVFRWGPTAMTTLFASSSLL